MEHQLNETNGMVDLISDHHEPEGNNWNGGSQIGQLLIHIIRHLEAEQNPSIFTLSRSSADAETIEPGHGNEGEAVQQENVVSSVSARLINTVYPFVLQDCINDGWELESFTENVDISELDDERWLEENVVHVSYVNDTNEDYSESNRIRALPENVILLRLIWDFSLQIIWSSKHSWSGLKERLQDDTYDFDFKHEAIVVNIEAIDDTMTDTEADEVTDDTMVDTESDEDIDNVMRASEVVNNLPTVIISEDNGDGQCVICQDPILIWNSVKQLPCNHLYHSHCILPWFRVRISCPICRDESASNYCIE